MVSDSDHHCKAGNCDHQFKVGDDDETPDAPIPPMTLNWGIILVTVVGTPDTKLCSVTATISVTVGMLKVGGIGTSGGGLATVVGSPVPGSVTATVSVTVGMLKVGGIGVGSIGTSGGGWIN
jgi:hypothetical protein